MKISFTCASHIGEPEWAEWLEVLSWNRVHCQSGDVALHTVGVVDGHRVAHIFICRNQQKSNWVDNPGIYWLNMFHSEGTNSYETKKSHSNWIITRMSRCLTVLFMLLSVLEVKVSNIVKPSFLFFNRKCHENVPLFNWFFWQRPLRLKIWVWAFLFV